MALGARSPRDESDGLAAADAAAERAMRFVAVGRWAETREQVREARRLAALLGDDARQRIELLASAAAVLVEWHTYGGDAQYRELKSVLRGPRARNELRAEHGPALLALGSVQSRRGRFSEAVDTLTLARLVVTDPFFRVGVLAELALARLRSGDWDGAWIAVDAALEHSTSEDDPLVEALVTSLVMLRAAFTADRETIAATAAPLRTMLERGWSPLTAAIAQHARVCLILGEDVWDELLRAGRDVDGLGYRPLHLPDERRTFELLALTNQGDAAGVRLLVDEWAGVPDAERSAYYWIGAAVAADHEDDHARVMVALENAERTLTGGEDPLGRAHVLMSTGSIIAGRISPVEGMAWWERASDGLRRIGADAFVVLCERVIEERSRMIAESTGNPLNALTPQQRSVVDLVAEGLTSAEIADRLHLSKRTVDFHVANAVARLGLSSRREMRGVLRRWALPEA